MKSWTLRVWCLRSISTLHSITSESTYLSCYTFIDILSAGLTYHKGDVAIEVFTDTDCKNKVTSWAENDGHFTVSYNTTEDGKEVMSIEMTENDLTEINRSAAVYSDASMVNSGFSDCTMLFTVGGILLMAGATFVLYTVTRKKSV